MDPPYLGLLKGQYGVSTMGWFKNYQEKFINTSRFRPIMHIMGFVLVVGYAMEYPHLRRARRAPTARARASARARMYPLAPNQAPRLAHAMWQLPARVLPGPHICSDVDSRTYRFAQMSSTRARRSTRSRAAITRWHTRSIFLATRP